MEQNLVELKSNSALAWLQNFQVLIWTYIIKNSTHLLRATIFRLYTDNYNISKERGYNSIKKELLAVSEKNLLVAQVDLNIDRPTWLPLT